MAYRNVDIDPDVDYVEGYKYGVFSLLLLESILGLIVLVVMFIRNS